MELTDFDYLVFPMASYLGWGTQYPTNNSDNSQNALPSLWSMTTIEMLPECKGPFEFLDLISTGGRQLCKCGNYTIFKPILKNNVRLPVAICYSLSFTSLNLADFGFTNRCCRALCVNGGPGECLIWTH